MRSAILAVFSLSATLFFTACASPMMASRLSKLSQGMERSNVLAIMGEPVSVSNSGNIEIFNYKLPETKKEANDEVDHRFIVRLKDGKVEAFGRPEDIK